MKRVSSCLYPLAHRLHFFSPSFSDNIESNVFSIASDTRGAAEELSTASEYQRKAGRRAACLMIILVVVVAIVLLAVRVFENARHWMLTTTNFPLDPVISR